MRNTYISVSELMETDLFRGLLWLPDSFPRAFCLSSARTRRGESPRQAPGTHAQSCCRSPPQTCALSQMTSFNVLYMYSRCVHTKEYALQYEIRRTAPSSIRQVSQKSRNAHKGLYFTKPVTYVVHQKPPDKCDRSVTRSADVV